ncbi:MAG: class I adenylate cyclase [Pseudomonadales bacterium]|nr:class I adenylate cyclase [Pseudomonadales bacterium]
MAINSLRRERWQQQATERQRQFLDVLPLLLDVNHALLPGFVGKGCPCRLLNYEPDENSLHQARLLAHSFTWQVLRQPAALQALYLMGSCGTIAQTTASDLDFWVCVRDDLDEESVGLLQRKLERIHRYAVAQDVQANFFIMKPHAFRQGKTQELSHEDCGSTQHVLLLDEFYRSSMLLAGAYPLWWLVPVEHETAYEPFTQTLIRQRHIKVERTLNLGGVAPVPVEEFLGAGLWQLYKGVEHPYKAVLKILLTEVYASELPQVRTLSLEFKHHVYLNDADADALDPYVLLYNKVAIYLQSRGETARLELARQCFYLKADECLSRPVSHPGWRRRLLQSLVDSWGWGRTELHLLDVRSGWKFRPAQELQERLVLELQHAYQLLSLQCQHQGGAPDERLRKDLDLLDRRLGAVYRQRPGKVMRLNPQLAGDRGEDVLFLHESKDGSNWSLSEGPELAPLYTASTALEVLTWAWINGLAQSSTRWRMLASSMPKFELDLLRYRVQSSDVLRSSAVEDEQLASPPCWQAAMLLINPSTADESTLSKRGLARVAQDGNPLSYGGLRENLLRRIDLVARNSWQELIMHSFVGERALAEALMCLLTGMRSRPILDVVHVTRDSTSGSLVDRLGSMANAVMDLAEKNNLVWIYILRAGEGYQLITHQGRGHYETFYLLNLAALEGILALPSLHRAEVHADPRSLQYDAISRILISRRPGWVRLVGVRSADACQLVLDAGDGRLWLSMLDRESALEMLWDEVTAHDETVLRRPVWINAEDADALKALKAQAMTSSRVNQLFDAIDRVMILG